MSLATRLSAITAMTAALAVAVPVATAGAAVPTLPSLGSHALPSFNNPNACPSFIVDPGPFGPSGPYGPQGPYGPNGPLHNATNPIGNAATCGGGITYFLRGGNVSSFVNANLASVGITPSTP